MADKYLPVTDDLYDAVLLLQRRLQDAYGDDVSIADTIDFLGHQFFINKRLLDGARIVMDMIDEDTKCKLFKGLVACPQDQRSVVDDVLGIFGLQRPEDPTCVLETGVEVPLHWAATRWVLDVEARNMVRCLSRPETGGQVRSGSRKVDID
ncbi:MAG: hypothetical protein HPY61_04355 [Methanotrichaceae archaeon]|nr:hypothetical protein [Methanotrichaceae archaeon]